MGVSGLLPLLESIQRPVDLRNCRGQTLGIDAYGWLHRGALKCAVDLAQGKPTTSYIETALYQVRMLKSYGVTPFMVFDGDYLPSKAATEASRAANREQNKKIAIALLQAGKLSDATQQFKKCVDITPQMAKTLIEQLKKLNVPFVVAPYEADAQLVHLEHQGLIDGIISEDSDLLVFGAKRLLTKLKRAQCIEINRCDFSACRSVSLVNWSDADFRRMAIFSGCDYFPGLPGVGLKTAHRMLRKYKDPERVVRAYQRDGGKRLPDNFLKLFYQAERTFLYQWVYSPQKRQLVHLNNLTANRTAKEMPFIGAYVEPKLAEGIAFGRIDPITKMPMCTGQTPFNVIDPDPPPPGPPITSYFKPRGRIPLGAMEKNCFTLDHKDVTRLTREGQLPRVFPLPRPYIKDSDPIPTAARTQPRPQKKARLCDDDADEDGFPKKSKFFAPPSAKTQPKSDIYLLSDDSIEEDLRDLPDWDGLKMPDKQRKRALSFVLYDEEDAAPAQAISTQVSVRE